MGSSAQPLETALCTFPHSRTQALMYCSAPLGIQETQARLPQATVLHDKTEHFVYGTWRSCTCTLLCKACAQEHSTPARIQACAWPQRSLSVRRPGGTAHAAPRSQSSLAPARRALQRRRPRRKRRRSSRNTGGRRRRPHHNRRNMVCALGLAVCHLLLATTDVIKTIALLLGLEYWTQQRKEWLRRGAEQPRAPNRRPTIE